ncbi:hypothetical protein [Saccharicrinis sp. FJH54]|uniref:hypothetical protein n=1 Tax=Saccharicrinis sp. FJH54 TaxID=3344665 RepID=UPI0035D43782
MRFKEFYRWFRKMPFLKKWFVFFIIIRPIIEPFYFFKEISVVLSPLYWIGLLTFVFSIFALVRYKTNKLKKFNSFKIWGIFVIFSSFTLIFSSSLVVFLNFFIKLTYPVLIFFFLRVLIKNKVDLIGVLTSFLYSMIFVVGWFLYDIFEFGFNLRFGSSYADIVNYGFYANFAFILLIYFFIESRSKKKLFKFNINPLVLIVSVLAIISALWAIKHLASIAVFIGISIVFLLTNSGTNKKLSFIALFVYIGFILTFGGNFYEEVMSEKVEKEIEVAEGVRDEAQLFHGRGSRWIWLWDEYKNGNTFSYFFGYPYNLRFSFHMVGITPHNDFLRILFLTGIFGLLFYLSFIFNIFKRIRFLNERDKFLFYSSLLTFILYSLSTVPTFYPGFNNFIFTTFAYLTLPKGILKYYD